MRKLFVRSEGFRKDPIQRGDNIFLYISFPVNTTVTQVFIYLYP